MNCPKMNDCSEGCSKTLPGRCDFPNGSKVLLILSFAGAFDAGGVA